VGGLLKRIEKEQHAADVRRERRSAERCLGNERKSAFAAGKQPSQVDLPLLAKVVQLVAAAVDLATWLAVANGRFVLLQNLVDAADERIDFCILG